MKKIGTMFGKDLLIDTNDEKIVDLVELKLVKMFSDSQELMQIKTEREFESFLKKQTTHGKIWMNVLGAIFFVIVFWWLFWIMPAQEKAVMSVDYCFQEQADGSYYHYVCEK